VIAQLYEAEHLDDAEEAKDRRKFLRLNQTTGKITGQLPTEGMALLASVLDPLAAPTPAEDGSPDPRSPEQRLADALVELARRALASEGFANNHGYSHRVMVSIGLSLILGT
jgi:hypothetical protein